MLSAPSVLVLKRTLNIFAQLRRSRACENILKDKLSAVLLELEIPHLALSKETEAVLLEVPRALDDLFRAVGFVLCEEKGVI